MGPKREAERGRGTAREREGDGRNEAGVALTASRWLAAWLFAWPFLVCLFASPPIRVDAGVLVCSLASLCLTKPSETGGERERDGGISGCGWLFGWLSGPRHC